ncbi:MAG: hydrogenase expression protein HypE [Blastocatellia bacterium]|nr:hydrogenase expression protein HypE [Blastocatellia bacterium]
MGTIFHQPARPAPLLVTILWITAGLGCDGESVALTAATQPSLEDLLQGSLPGMPNVKLLNPFYSYENGGEYLSYLEKAATGLLSPFILVVEGSLPNEKNKAEGYWAALGTDPETGQPIPTCTWMDRLAPHAWAVVAVGTCAAYGGIHAMAGNPTGAMGVPDYLGWNWKSSSGNPIVCVPGCPTQPDNLTETLLYLLFQIAGRAPMIPLDEVLRPKWLFSATVHESCDRGGYYEQAQFAENYGSEQCIVKLGCWGPVVQCNVGKRHWVNGVGGCPSVGGICIGCTMPGFPDKFMPFMDQPPGSLLSTQAVLTYGRSIHALRRYTMDSLNRAPDWRHPQATPSHPQPTGKKGESHE